MRIVVTGGTGFIGQHLVRELVEDGHQVITLSSKTRVSSLVSEHHQCAIDSLEARSIAARGEAIIHLAGLSEVSLSYKQPFLYNWINALGTLNILEGARETKPLFLFASSQRIYQPQPFPLAEDAPKEPGDPYGYSKLVAEHWVKMYNTLYGMPTVILRFFSVYGPGQLISGDSSGVASILLQRALAGLEMVVEGRQLRDFTYVADVTRAIALILQNPACAGQVYNIATGVATSIEELALLIREVTGMKSALRLVLGDRPACGYVADITRAQKELGYKPLVPLRSGLELYASWLKQIGQDCLESTTDQKTATG
ncbi:MAG: NAD-dependent epimerase/dehydratase family protein [Chloroflexi bacterium]|nr:NAD-dependent epimerase/dehydratase family protein [Chloroflexota bacterium]MCL5075395.1 NAD-dependent epimerase/dehydratase family protein [Chloroflexota bacterium]